MKKTTKNEHLKTLGRGLKWLYKLDKGYSVSLFLGSFLAAAIPFIPIYFSALIIDELVGAKNIDRLTVLVVLTVGLSFLFWMARNLLSRYNDLRFNYMWRGEQRAFSDKTMHMDYEHLEDREVHLLRERLKVESQTGYNIYYLRTGIRGLIGNLTKIVSSVILTIGLFATPSVRWWMKGLFVFLALTVVGAGLFSSAKAQNTFHKFFGEASKHNAMGNFISDFFTDYKNGKDIRIFDMGSFFIGYNRKVTDELSRQFVCVLNKKSVYDALVVFADHLLRYGTYLFTIYACVAGGISVGSIAKYVSCVVLLISGLSSIVTDIYMLLNNTEYLKRYFGFFEIKDKMYHGTLTIEKRDDNQYEIEFHNVSFRYPNTDFYAVRDLNLKLRVGEKLAVVGMNGSGKTTMIKLLCRLYDPTEGEITLNGIDIRKYDYEEYMRIFGVVFQDFNLFAFSLGQNVAADVDYDGDKVADCCKKSGLALNHLTPEVYLYKNFDESGVEISGGEAQKLALARALYKDAPFIVLDEPTAALDPVAEYEIYSKFNEIVGDKTAIYISHRLSSCRFCDDIAVFDKGRLVQRGSHDELIQNLNGKYYELWSAQAQYYA